MNKWERMMSGLIPSPPFITVMVRTLEDMGYREDPDAYNWVPTENARAEVAKRFPLLLQPFDDLPNGKQLFGIALHLCLPNAEAVLRRVGKGRKARGYAGAVGPGGIRSLDPDEGHLRWMGLPGKRNAPNAKDTGSSPS